MPSADLTGLAGGGELNAVLGERTEGSGGVSIWIATGTYPIIASLRVECVSVVPETSCDAACRK